MEYNIYTILEEKLKEIYGLEGESSGYLYKYVSMRLACANNTRKVKSNVLFDFILSEVNLSVFKTGQDHLVYKDEGYYLREVYIEMMDNFEFRAEMEGTMESFKEELEEVFRKGYMKAQKYKKSSNYQKHLALERLKVLNNHMGANPICCSGIEGFKTDGQHNPFKRTLEESLSCEIEAKKTQFNTSYITEKILEDYVSQNLDLIEDGLKLIKTQYEVKGGTIDILAKDKNGVICIIELKINEDKSIIWQTIHYPSEIKREYKVSNVRMITLAPSYSSPILNALNQNVGVECFRYNVTTEGKEIVDLKVYSVNS